MKDGKRLSILLVSSYEFLQNPGGVRDFILGLKKNLLKLGCVVNVVAPGSQEAREKGLVDYILGMGFRVTTDQTEFRASLSRKETAEKILNNVKPDIIVLHEPFVPSIGHTIISSLNKIRDTRERPIIVGQFHARRGDFNWSLTAAEFVFRHFIRRPKFNRRTVLGFSSGYVMTINSNLDARIAVSQATKKFWEEKLPADYKVIYNGIDVDRLTPDGPKIKSWMKNKKKIILFAGRHDRRKGIEDLINAFNILIWNDIDDIRLKITGRGEMTLVLERMVRELGLQRYVEFTGILSQNNLAKAYRTADLMVASSTEGEGFNRTIIEARSCGTLVVCTDIKGHQEAIGKDLYPFMAKPKNSEHLAQQIMAVLDMDKARKSKISKKSREEAKALFGWENIAKKHLNFYKNLVLKTK
jgi:phosphatidylinositol alpha-mannosyltransferase